jgi:hypothetical protein
MLTEARLGKLSGGSIRRFSCLQRPVVYKDGIDATELVSFRLSVKKDCNHTNWLWFVVPDEVSVRCSEPIETQEARRRYSHVCEVSSFSRAKKGWDMY